MKLIFRTLLVALAALAITSTAFGQADRAGSKDYPGITRMPGFFIDGYSDMQFDSATFTVDRNGKKTPQAIEGRTIRIPYYRKRDTPPSRGMAQMTMPSGARSATAVPVAITVGSASSPANAVTTWVK